MAAPRQSFWVITVAIVAGAMGFSWVGWLALRALPVVVDSSLQPALAAMTGKKVGPYFSHVADLPPAVLEAARLEFGSQSFEMADAGGPWNATDVAVGSLPFRRLIWATAVDEHFILHYEMGGIGHSWHVLVFGPIQNGRRECVWAGSAEQSFWSVYTFSRGAAAGKILSNPAFMH